MAAGIDPGEKVTGAAIRKPSPRAGGWRGIGRDRLAASGTRSSQRGKGTEVRMAVVTSEAVDAHFRSEARALGGYDVVTKPLNSDEVRRVLSTEDPHRSTRSDWRQLFHLGRCEQPPDDTAEGSTGLLR